MIKCFTSLKKRLGKINRIPSLTESWLDISIIFTMLKVENKTKTILDLIFSIPEFKELPGQNSQRGKLIRKETPDISDIILKILN